MSKTADLYANLPFYSASKKRRAAEELLRLGEASREYLAEFAELPGPTVTQVIKDLTGAGYQIERRTDGDRKAWFKVLGYTGTPSTPQLPRRRASDVRAPGRAAAVDVAPRPVADTAPSAADVAALDSPLTFHGAGAAGLDLEWPPMGRFTAHVIGSSIPMSLLSGTAQVLGMSVHPAAGLVLRVGTADDSVLVRKV